MDNFMFSRAVGTAGSQGRSGQGCSCEGVSPRLRLPSVARFERAYFFVALLWSIPGGRVVGRRGSLPCPHLAVRWRSDWMRSPVSRCRFAAGLSSHAVTKLWPDDHDRGHDQLQARPKAPRPSRYPSS